MTKTICSILKLVLVISTILVGCSPTEQNENTVTQSVASSNYILEITTPSVIVTGETLKVKGTLTYTGIESIEVSHGEPIIRFSFSGSDEARSYTDVGYLTEFEPGHTIDVEDEFLVTNKGEHILIVRIDRDISLTMNPINVRVQ